MQCSYVLCIENERKKRKVCCTHFIQKCHNLHIIMCQHGEIRAFTGNWTFWMHSH